LINDASITYSDHERFWAYGYKAILLIENAPPWSNNLPWYTANPYYHRAQDTHDKVNFDQVAKITKATLAAVACRTKGVTSIPQQIESENISRDFVLQANYPNPFNAGTMISYHLRTAGKVKINIFSSSGEKVTEIANQWQPAGYYRMQWEAADQYGKALPSGIYFLRMEFNSLFDTRKIMLVK
jgi:hypothetical protein